MRRFRDKGATYRDESALNRIRRTLLWNNEWRKIIEHLSEVVKILEGAVKHDPRQSASYAALLADKLESTGQRRQASLLRGVLSKAAARSVSGAGGVTVVPPPVDQESKISTVDVSNPALEADKGLFLSASAQADIDAFLEAIHQRDLLLSHGIEIPARLLLHGPPGTGKTSIAREIASRLNLPLVTTRSDTLVSSLLGQTSRNIREVFDFASRIPCVLFLDEFDALAKNRSDVREVGELQRVVIALLENLDTFGSTNVLIAATNHPQLLDPAVWRRFDHTLVTRLPGYAERRLIWGDALRAIEVAANDLNQLASFSEGMSGSAIRAAGMDIARVEVLAYSPKLRLPSALRRLAKYLASDNPQDDGGAEIRALRGMAPAVFTIRKLADLFEISTRQVSKHLKELDDGPEPDTSTSVSRE